ncbi:acetyltransferase, GNAT family protein [Roseobacter sp. SK209-2-6]|uniref:GNAT family N-acetyltransferase n=1 Tax=Roseobacter sp. SK209-2-6 TaxID=388739 RepID=UPI0000F3D074|nr:GNAT family N-acetyltransferase [Roseobacter sp. SK209-2-6]EBA15114.1 acetyltransferase, GNAT family protein [Roseobacter sp. SK209-2-6]
MLWRASEADLPRLRGFLAPRVATSMFLSGNLSDFGLSKGSTGDHPKSMTLWFSEDAGEIRNVFGYANAGYFVFEAPDFNAELIAPLRQALSGCELRGLNGSNAQAKAIVEALDLPMVSAVMDEAEPHYALKTANLEVPDGSTQLRPALVEDLDLLTNWRIASEVEILGGKDAEANRAYARSTLQELLKADRLRILEEAGQPVAMTNFNASLPSIVQVGGVFTPPEYRGIGHARRAVALHLAEAREAGVQEAILFAASPAAARAYEAIGFVRIGDYRIVNFDPPVTLPAILEEDLS